ncbi:hypothetical protein G9C98_006264 [Cotesia typhae]|uniref:LIM zinc-binding domain-containing protein n=1 Tax=Cotesia typhae TaxID=2053667 RepID=A0A8J5VAA8_9HYME|nr:hypothetical protein G9C98_006264 [Cotesia typhae]
MCSDIEIPSCPPLRCQLFHAYFLDFFSFILALSSALHVKMPFKPVEHPKCPKCSKSVYAAEERVAGGLKWHKMCFKCGLCSKLLDSTNCSEHEGELFCKVCHARKFGPKGYGFGGGAGCLSMDQGEHLQRDGDLRGSSAVMEPRAIAKAPEGEGCPRCGGFVYAAEQMLARGRNKIKNSNDEYESMQVCQCIKKKSKAGVILCLLNSYDQAFHKACYKCKICNRTLDSTLHCDGPDREIYCRAPRTKVSDTASIQAPPGKGCPRCGGVVFAAEQVLAKDREWHRKCFKCKDCTKTLDSIIACDGPDKDVYCKTCYGKKWGPHGYGFACGSGFLQTDGLTEEEIAASRPFYNPDTTSIKAPAGQGCPRCGGMVFAAEQQLAKGTMWHKKCFNCAECHRPLDSMLACDGPDKEIHCRSTDGHGCSRCGYPVYAAEQMISKDRLWHKRCFSCGACHRSLDSTNLNDGPDGDIYCRGCYGRKFGPRGVGFGMGAGTLTMA